MKALKESPRVWIIDTVLKPK